MDRDDENGQPATEAGIPPSPRRVWQTPRLLTSESRGAKLTLVVFSDGILFS